jgi:flavin reductase (DIM6/NTAB) family NADH-FMN oxidoreductase RutF
MLKVIKPELIPDNPFTLIDKDWFLVTANMKDENGGARVNTMTASWGGLGVLWNRNVATIYLRPSRYTKEFVDSSETFSLSVLSDKYRSKLNYLGSHSGRDEDKIAVSKLTVVDREGTPYFKEARLVLICRKLFAQPFAPESFTDERIMKSNYKDDDFHTMYIGEIMKVMKEN